MSFTSALNLTNIKTVEQLDACAKRIAETMGDVFPPAPNFDGKKKNKLRDFTARLAGFENGYQQFLAHLASFEIAKPTDTFDLPDDIVVVFPTSDMNEYLVVGKPASKDACGRQGDNEIYPEHENALHTLYDDGEIDETRCLKDMPLWQYIAYYYRATHAEVIMPNISKYGLTDEATDIGGVNMVEDMYLTITEDFCVDPIDRGDDGSAVSVIYLSRKKD